MATIREWLTCAEFDWENGVVVYQGVERYDEDDPECGNDPGWSDPISSLVVGRDHPVLNWEFETGYGGPRCPRFYARDSVAVYFPAQYDGATWLEKVRLDPAYYLDIAHPTPYP
jgi:hypothetical protein